METTIPLWIEAVTKVGFPIAMVLALCIFIVIIYKDNKKEKEKLLEINNKSIETLGKYADRLTIIEEDVNEIKTELKVLAHGGKV